MGTAPGVGVQRMALLASCAFGTTGGAAGPAAPGWWLPGQAHPPQSAPDHVEESDATGRTGGRWARRCAAGAAGRPGSSPTPGRAVPLVRVECPSCARVGTSGKGLGSGGGPSLQPGRRRILPAPTGARVRAGAVVARAGIGGGDACPGAAYAAVPGTGEARPPRESGRHGAPADAQLSGARTQRGNDDLLGLKGRWRIWRSNMTPTCASG